ncbi:MAG: hypothetical protein ACYSWX_06900 [Planctomycetota bacterium]|jgi:hypothetical protein
MMVAVRGHFYQGGEQRPLGRGRAVAGGTPWPRAKREDLEAARASLGSFDAGVALRALARAREPIGEDLERILAERLGISPDDAARAAGWVAAPMPNPVTTPGEGTLEPDGEPRVNRDPRVWSSHWTDLADRALLTLEESFRAGRPVLWLGDDELPEVCWSVTTRLLEAGLEPAALALLHACDPALRSQSRRDAERTMLEVVVGPSDDLEAAAAHCVGAAFGDLPTLGGRRAGGVGLVWCAARRFAEFTEALVAAIDALEEPLLEPLDGGARRDLARTVERALDHGATPIRGCAGGWEPSLVTNWERREQPVGAEPVPGTLASVPLLRLGRFEPAPGPAGGESPA